MKTQSNRINISTLTLIALIPTLVILSACGQGFEAASNPPPSAAAARSDKKTQHSPSDDPIEHAEYLVDSAELEIDFTSRGFSKALGLLSEARTLNPDNHRAGFWYHLVASFMELDGILQRVRPLYLNTTDGERRYQEFIDEIYRDDSALSRLMAHGPEDIEAPEQFQEWMDRANARIFEFRSYLTSIQKKEITINIPRRTWEVVTGLKKNSKCSTLQFGPIKYSSPSGACVYGNTLNVGLNQADFHLLGAMLGYYQILFELMTAYHLNPALLTLTEEEKTNDGLKNFEMVFDRILATSQSGELRKGNPFTGIPKVTADVAKGIRYMTANQKELCPDGLYMGAGGARKGYLFEFPMCFGKYQLLGSREKMNRTLQTLELLFSGRPAPVQRNGRFLKTRVRGDRLLESPVANLRLLTPLRRDETTGLVLFNSAALDLYFENGTYESFLREFKSSEAKAALTGDAP